MAAPVAKGIIISLSIIAGLAAAATQSPQVQAWLEEQRKRIAELLRQLGEELDPQARRAAEAFAFEGRTVNNDSGLARESAGSKEAAALATGRRLSSPSSTVRRIPVRGPSDPDEAEERRRKGREYLAKRNQQLYELQQRRKAAAAADGLATPPSPTFDELVDSEGNLKRSELWNEKELPAVPNVDPLSETVQQEMKEVERHLVDPIAADEAVSTGSSGWSLGSRYANPFGDEYELERSVTPKPPIPPKIQLDQQPELARAPTPPISVPGAFDSTPTAQQTEHVDHSALSYEEQLAIALSLSEQNPSSTSATVRQRKPEQEDVDLKAAIAASLRDMDHHQAAHAIANVEPVTPRVTPADAQVLIDLTPSTPTSSESRRDWSQLSSPVVSRPRHPGSLDAIGNNAPSEASDELYRLTPELTKARLASHNEQQMTATSRPSVGSTLPFDPVRDAAASSASQPAPDVMDASFYSAHAEPSPAPSSATFDRDTPMLVDVADDAPQEGQRTPTSRAQSSFGFQTESDTDTFASVSAPPSRTMSRAESRADSEISGIEVIDLTHDSDVDMMSEEGDGIATPDSWSEVGSRDADSDTEEAHPHQRSRVSL
ncbi:hypothetical protein CKM354_000041300 [Cercospora kikuchii]|uniref:Uncharacterized protein n=1 Tax=Cercospora kikuchii TaxID=84275 RepID=A0A9P3F7R2_9PEZI|nr:uncharacterized protein CKM354_000041300 [Cercospora kikuchii]GIZ36948.1 hypothetical protein CKM354_000041300 [Cercospora kikuchii]